MNITKDPLFLQTAQGLHNEVVNGLQARKKIVLNLELKDLITQSCFTLAVNICIDRRNREQNFYNDSSTEKQNRVNYFKLAMEDAMSHIIPPGAEINFQTQIATPVDHLLSQPDYKDTINTYFNSIFGSEEGNVL